MTSIDLVTISPTDLGQALLAHKYWLRERTRAVYILKVKSTTITVVKEREGYSVKSPLNSTFLLFDEGSLVLITPEKFKLLTTVGISLSAPL